jgi:hypothetical protein
MRLKKRERENETKEDTEYSVLFIYVCNVFIGKGKAIFRVRSDWSECMEPMRVSYIEIYVNWV